VAAVLSVRDHLKRWEGLVKNNELCELYRANDFELLYRVAKALEGRGIGSDVRGRPGIWRAARSSGKSALVVPCKDLVYARWVAFSAGLNTWPEESIASESGSDEPSAQSEAA
jgi:hypothetical protein